MTPNLANNRERRTHTGKVEIRAAIDSGNSPGTIAGYAATFNTPSVDLGGFLEKIAPGAFNGCMGDDVRALFNHGDSSILGRSTSGTLRFEEDSIGLRFECDLPNTTLARDLAESIRRGDVTGCSFQFMCGSDGVTWDFSGPIAVRTITKVSRLYDVGPVTFPAYESTTVDMRSFEAARDQHEAMNEARSGQAISHYATLQKLLELHLY